MNAHFLSIDLPAMLAAVLAATLCAICGTFLIVRKEAMFTDTLSHAVLPGLVVAYLAFHTLHPLVMSFGALISCLIAAGLVFLLKTYARISPAAAMGIVFTSMFALGLVLLEKFIGSGVHLDAHHALYGALELTYWPVPHDFETLPQTIKTLGVLLIVTLCVLPIFFQTLKYTSFDPVYAQTQGMRLKTSYVALLFLTVLTATACFDALGVVLVIALFVCPPAIARLFSNNLSKILILAILIGSAIALSGYAMAAFAPPLFGFDHALSAGGMIAALSGLVLFLSVYYKSKFYLKSSAKTDV